MEDPTYCRTLAELTARYAPDGVAMQRTSGAYEALLNVYEIASATLANGQKDRGLQCLYALSTALGQVAMHDDRTSRLKEQVKARITRWGTGFDWD
jgi:hypothetical protein